MPSLDAMMNAIDPGDDPLRWQDDAQHALKKARELIRTTKWADPEERASAREELADLAVEAMIEAATNPAFWEGAYRRVEAIRERIQEQRPERWRERAEKKKAEARELAERAAEATGPAQKQRLAARAADAEAKAQELEQRAAALEAGLGNSSGGRG